MGYSGVRAILAGIALALCGAAATVAWQRGLWGSFAGATLAGLWLATLNLWLSTASPAAPRSGGAAVDPDPVANRLLLDAAPTPMLGLETGRVRVLNRAARRLFASDDRVLPIPAGLADPAARHIRHEGRQWRVDRVLLTGREDGPMVAALIDVEQEERVAEARATAEMIHVLGHELLNGLAPIASLAESGVAALDAQTVDPALLREILATLARRAEGLQRFTEAYRALARLPEPLRRPVRIEDLADDLARLFAGRWPQVTLTLDAAPGSWPLDRDQISQAVWALLQNAAEAVAATDRRAVALVARHDAAMLTIDIEDHANGVAADQIGRIFRPFHTTKPDGTGVGLSLARQIALAHGGALTLEPGPPTRFRLAIPSVRPGGR